MVMGGPPWKVRFMPASPPGKTFQLALATQALTFTMVGS